MEAKAFKHQNMADGNGTMIYPKGKFNKRETMVYRCANYFWFVMPANMVPVEDIPPYCGLIYVQDVEPFVQVVIKAPKLHGVKATPELTVKVAKNLTNKLLYGSSFTRYRHQLNQEEWVK